MSDLLASPLTGWARLCALTALLAGACAAASSSLASAQTAPDTVRLVFVGDVMLDDGPGKAIAEGRDPLAPFASRLTDADFTIGNLEVPVATVGKPMDSKIFSFRAHPRVMGVLKGRFDALALANNHSGDYGKEAFLETMQHLDAAGIARFGGGRNLAEAHEPLWVRKNGLKIAVLAYNEFKPRSFEAGADTPGIAWSEDSHVVADIRAARAAGADLVIPYMHWGWERERQPSQRQRQLARLMIDNGADVPGTPLGNCSEDFRRRFAEADCIISKGMGNFECLSEVQAPIFFLFVVKCTTVLAHLRHRYADAGLRIGSPVLAQGRPGGQGDTMRTR